MADQPAEVFQTLIPSKRSAEQRRATELVKAAAATQPGERKCNGKVKLKLRQSEPVGPDNPYLRDADGKIQKRPCKKVPIRGGVVCEKHGGNIKAVRAKANMRLLAMVEPALVRLHELMHQEGHLPTALGAIQTVLNRAGANPIGPQAKDAGGDARPIIHIGIKVGGIDKPTVEVGMLPTADNIDAEEVELVGDDDGPSDSE